MTIILSFILALSLSPWLRCFVAYTGVSLSNHNSASSVRNNKAFEQAYSYDGIGWLKNARLEFSKLYLATRVLETLPNAIRCMAGSRLVVPNTAAR